MTTKLDQEPNPFEQSFSGASGSENANGAASNNKTPTKFVLPPAASIASPSPGILSKGIFPKDMAEQFAWDSLRTGPLSPSMLQRPADPSYTMDGAQLGTNNRISPVSNAPGGFSFQGMTPNTLYGTNGNPQAAPAATAGQYQGEIACQTFLLLLLPFSMQTPKREFFFLYHNVSVSPWSCII